MKKIISVICIILLSFTFFACAAAAPVIVFDSEKPWGNYEKSVYSVEIVERVELDGALSYGRVFADGELTYELETYREGGIDFVKLVTDFSVKYRDDDYVGVNAGLEDTIRSEVRFLSAGCMPVYSEKIAEFAARKNSEGVYADTHSYKYTADYNTKKASSYIGQYIDGKSGELKTQDENGSALGEYKEVKEFDILTDQVFDNEQLFYVVRAFSTLKPESAVSFSISNIYYIASNIDGKGKYEVTPFSVSVGADLSPVVLADGIFDGYKTGIENNTVNCMKATIGLSTSLPGPAFTAYYSDPAITAENSATAGITSKLLIKMVTVQYDLSTSKEAFNTVYTLKEYKTDK